MGQAPSCFRRVSPSECSPVTIEDLGTFVFLPLHRDSSFLHEKYIKEGLSPEQIAARFFSPTLTRKTIIRHLKAAGIVLRKEDQRSTGPLPYGYRWSKLKAVQHKREQSAIYRIRKLREQGMSYQKVAEVLNTMEVPTRTGKGKWHGNQVFEICQREKVLHS